MIQTETLRILMVADEFPFQSRGSSIGGGGSHVFYLTDALAKNARIKVTLLTTAGVYHPNAAVKVIGVRPDGFENYRLIQRVIKGVVKAERPDIVHAHHLRAGKIGLAIATEHNLPLVLTVHKPPKLTRLRAGYRFEDAEYSAWHTLGTAPQTIFNIAYSHGYIQELTRVGIPHERIRTIFHGVPLQALRSHAKQHPYDKKTLFGDDRALVLCPMRPDKPGLETFLGAARRIIQHPRSHGQRPEKVGFIITGSGGRKPHLCRGPRVHMAWKSKRERIRELNGIISAFGLQGNVMFREFGIDEMWSLLNVVDVVAIPSIREGLSIAAIEAMAMGKPLVATDTIGLEEVIHPGVSGVSFDAGKSDMLANRIEDILCRHFFARRLGFKAQQIASLRFDADRMAQEHVRLYDEVWILTRKVGFDAWGGEASLGPAGTSMPA